MHKFIRDPQVRRAGTQGPKELESSQKGLEQQAVGNSLGHCQQLQGHTLRRNTQESPRATSLAGGRDGGEGRQSMAAHLPKLYPTVATWDLGCAFPQGLVSGLLLRVQFGHDLPQFSGFLPFSP